MDITYVIVDFPGFARVSQELWLKGVLTQDVLDMADVLVWSINDYPALGTMAGRRVTCYKAVIADALLWSINDYPAFGTIAGRRVTGYKAVTADTLLWSINDYPVFGTIAGRRVSGYKACCHCYHKALSITSNVEHINHRIVRRLQRELLFGVEVEEGS